MSASSNQLTVLNFKIFQLYAFLCPKYFIICLAKTMQDAKQLNQNYTNIKITSINCLGDYNFELQWQVLITIDKFTHRHTFISIFYYILFWLPFFTYLLKMFTSFGKRALVVRDIKVVRARVRARTRALTCHHLLTSHRQMRVRYKINIFTDYLKFK